MSKAPNKSPDSGEGKKPVEKIQRPAAKKKGKTTQEMMSQHIHDEKDIISDEDFKNLEINFDLPKDEAHQPLEISNEEDRPKDEDKDPKIMTPWDLINPK